MSNLCSNVLLTIMTCGSCGCEFAIPETMRAEKERSGGSWFCPNGHSRVYSETQADKFRKLYEKEQREAASLREAKIVAERAQQKAEKHIERLKKRVAAGVCPCCNRTVSQLTRHMNSKHAEYVALQGLAPRKQLPEKVN